MLIPTRFELSKKTKVEKNYDHFTKKLRFGLFSDASGILRISQRGKSFESLESDIRDRQHIIYRIMEKKARKKFLLQICFTCILPLEKSSSLTLTIYSIVLEYLRNQRYL